MQCVTEEKDLNFINNLNGQFSQDSKMQLGIPN